MDLHTWSYANQIALENLEVHVQHWEEWLLLQEPLLVRHTTNKPLQASLTRHLDLSRHTLALLEQQQELLARLKAQTAKRLA